MAGRYRRFGADASDPKCADLAEVILWLRGHNFENSDIAALLGISSSHLRVILTRARQRGPKVLRDPVLLEGIDDLDGSLIQTPSAAVRRLLGLRNEEDSVGLNRRSWARLSDLEASIDSLGLDLWNHLPYGEALALVTGIRPRFGWSSHVARVRLLARLHHLKSMSYLHVGRSWSAIQAGLHALQAARVHYAESHKPGRSAALKQMAATALLISQAYLLRHEPLQASRFLRLHWQASEANGEQIGADGFRQRGAAMFQQQFYSEAARYYRQAADAFARKLDEGQETGEHKLLDLSFRQANVLPPGNWDGEHGALELMAIIPTGAGEEALRFSNNARWAVAAGSARMIRKFTTTRMTCS
jgi:hypothetical protein